jgi:hypothetical protein
LKRLVGILLILLIITLASTASLGYLVATSKPQNQITKTYTTSLTETVPTTASLIQIEYVTTTIDGRNTSLTILMSSTSAEVTLTVIEQIMKIVSGVENVRFEYVVDCENVTFTTFNATTFTSSTYVFETNGVITEGGNNASLVILKVLTMSTTYYSLSTAETGTTVTATATWVVSGVTTLVAPFCPPSHPAPVTLTTSISTTRSGTNK